MKAKLWLLLVVFMNQVLLPYVLVGDIASSLH